MRIERLGPSGWTRVAGARTHHDGRYRLRRMTVPGTYRATAFWKRLSAGDVCIPAVSAQAVRP